MLESNQDWLVKNNQKRFFHRLAGSHIETDICVFKQEISYNQKESQTNTKKNLCQSKTNNLRKLTSRTTWNSQNLHIS